MGIWGRRRDIAVMDFDADEFSILVRMHAIG